GFNLDSVPEFCVQPRCWLNVILIDLFLDITWDRKISPKLRRHSRGVDHEFRPHLERLVNIPAYSLSLEPYDPASIFNQVQGLHAPTKFDSGLQRIVKQSLAKLRSVEHISGSFEGNPDFHVWRVHVNCSDPVLHLGLAISDAEVLVEEFDVMLSDRVSADPSESGLLSDLGLGIPVESENVYFILRLYRYSSRCHAASDACSYYD